MKTFMPTSTLRTLVASLAMLVVASLAAHFGYAPHALGLTLLAAGTMLTDEPSVKNLIALGLCQSAANGGQLNTYRRISAQLTNYTVLATDGSGTLFTNRAAVGAVTFTLPAPTPALIGTWFEFMGVADQTFTVAAPAGKVVTFNNAAATSVACSTGGQKIGARITALCDGTSWMVQGSSVGVTYTVA